MDFIARLNAESLLATHLRRFWWQIARPLTDR
jgi:hypothetical protein